MMKRWISIILAGVLLALCLLCGALAASEDEVPESTGEEEPLSVYPALAPPSGAGLVQRNAYVPAPEERSLSAEELLGSVTYLSDAVVKLMPETHEFISLDYQNTDLRELVALIGKVDGKHVLYFGDPVRVTVKANVVTPMKALDLTLEAADPDLTYVLMDDVIVVGPSSLVTNTFPYTDVVVTKRLNYLTVEALKTTAELQGIPYTAIEPTENGVSITAPPYELTYLLSLVEALDLKENFINADTAPELILERLELKYITGKQFLSLAEKFGVRAGVVDDYSNKHLVYLTGPDATITALRRTAASFDVEACAKLSPTGSAIQAQPYHLKTAAPADMKTMLESCGIAFNVLDMGDGRSTVYALGGQAETAQAVALMERLDAEGMRLLVIGSGAESKDMTWLRDVIVKETDLQKKNFVVTSNLGYGENRYYLCCIAGEEELAQAQPYVSLP
ncbi:MAG: hypothetical protein IJL39_05970 [Clostridia bacterium]|nr:hypothetical protein [Clostridia bacterium]